MAAMLKKKLCRYKRMRCFLVITIEERDSSNSYVFMKQVFFMFDFKCWLEMEEMYS